MGPGGEVPEAGRYHPELTFAVSHLGNARWECPAPCCCVLSRMLPSSRGGAAPFRQERGAVADGSSKHNWPRVRVRGASGDAVRAAMHSFHGFTMRMYGAGSHHQHAHEQIQAAQQAPQHGAQDGVSGACSPPHHWLPLMAATCLAATASLTWAGPSAAFTSSAKSITEANNLFLRDQKLEAAARANTGAPVLCTPLPEVDRPTSYDLGGYTHK